MPAQNQPMFLIHFGLACAAFYLLLTVFLAHYSVDSRTLLAVFLACPTFIPREWILFILSLQEQIVRETYRILDEY